MTKNRERLNEYFQDSMRNHWDLPALTDFNGATYHYRDVARKIAKLHLLYKHTGIKPGDRIAICGRNSSGWAVAFLSAVTYGAVVVPILHEFKADNIHHIVNHSESTLLFTNNSMWENLDPEQMPGIIGALRISDCAVIHSRSQKLDETRAHLNELFGREYPDRFTPEDIVYYDEDPDELCMINYTSGSTGFSKGVMLTYRNIWSNLQYLIDYLHILKAGDNLVCMLPMAHMYGLTGDFVHGIAVGAHLHFLTRNPSPRVIIEAFAKVKPKLIETVPLIIEKILKTRVFPLLDKPYMKLLMHVPFVDDRLMRRIKSQLKETFGGNLQEMIIGGAGINKEVEIFLNRIGFPYAIVYGMTECAPFITYEHWNKTKLQSCGRKVHRMELRIDSHDPVNVPGELWVRGDNVMQGYYKNPEATSAIMDEAGWMNTGDICTIDEDGYLYVRGRSKNLILGSSGQNIYPEEIEQQLNNMPYVSESVVIEENGKLVALVYPDYDNVARQGITPASLPAIMDDNLQQLNRELPSYCRLDRVKIFNEEFEKTAKKSIKRYLYQHK